MKRILCVGVLLVILTCGSSLAKGAVGSAFGCLTTGRSLSKGAGLAGLAVGIGMEGDSRNSLAGSIHYGMYEYIEVSGRLGLADADDVRLAVYGDLKYQFLDAGPELDDPFDLAVGPFFEYLDDVFQLGVQAIGSQLYQVKNGQTLEPYGRFNIRMESFNSNSNLEIGVNTGLRWGITPNMSLFGELQFDGNDGLFIGLKESIF